LADSLRARGKAHKAEVCRAVPRQLGKLLKNAILSFLNVACERRDFRCAPEIKRISAHDFAGSSLARTSRLFFNSLLVH
jgi:hypothetical protein